jgi:SAM-dependent methyltransferase
MAFRKSLFNEIGDFDESLWPCCGEEIDFCLRAKEKGHRIGIVYGCYVHHEASTTFKAIDAEHPYKEILERNEKHLDKKWGESWRDQSVSASPVPKGICLNLGCGLAKLEGYVNIDNREEVNPDVAWDLLAGIPYADNSVDMVRAYDFLEHIPPPSTVWLVEEIYRVLKPGGIFESSTPDAEHGQAAFQDPHHVSFWVENTWRYFSEDSERKLYGTKANFQIDSISRVESGNRVFHIHVIAKARK